MKIKELLSVITEKTIPKPTETQCKVRKLSNVRRSQCVALGLKSHDTDDTIGNGRQGVKGSGVSQMGKKLKSEKYGGPIKYYAGTPPKKKRK